MEETKLTVRVPRDLLRKAKHFAAQNNTTLTNLIEAYLQRLPDHAGKEAPIVHHITGILSPEISIEDYHKHLDDKYGQ